MNIIFLHASYIFFYIHVQKCSTEKNLFNQNFVCSISIFLFPAAFYLYCSQWQCDLPDPVCFSVSGPTYVSFSQQPSGPKPRIKPFFWKLDHVILSKKMLRFCKKRKTKRGSPNSVLVTSDHMVLAQPAHRSHLFTRYGSKINKRVTGFQETTSTKTYDHSKMTFMAFQAHSQRLDFQNFQLRCNVCFFWSVMTPVSIRWQNLAHLNQSTFLSPNNGSQYSNTTRISVEPNCSHPGSRRK